MQTVPPDDAADAANSPDPLIQLRRLLLHLDDDDLDLDAIDGEFYWRCCRRDLHAEVEKLVALISAFDPDATGPLTPEERAQAEVLLSAIDEVVRRFEPEHPLIGHFLFGTGDWRWIRLRDGRLTSYRAGPQDRLGSPPPGEREDRVELRVLSNRWQGAEVEARLRSYLDEPNNGLSVRSLRRWFDPGEDVAVRVSFEFAPSGTIGRDDYPLRAPPTFARPQIVVTMAPPLPPEGVIARLYDAVVIQTHHWPDRLPGSASRQDTRLAARTWSIGLLVGAGQKTPYAISAVCDVLGEDWVSPVQFTEDRHRLVARVPEAQPYLYAKPPRRPFLPHT
jgi:hypothetical protein